MGTRVLPADASLIDRIPARWMRRVIPFAGTYTLDDEGVPAQKVTIVDGGMLRGLLTSRRPVRTSTIPTATAAMFPGQRALRQQQSSPFQQRGILR